MKRNPIIPERLYERLRRWHYPILILLLGAALMLWPSKGEAQTPAPEAESAPELREDAGQAYRADMERQLELLLSQIDGAGRVRVMLSLKTGSVFHYQTDTERSEDREAERLHSASEEKTVMLSRGNAYNEPAVVSTAYPIFQGALVVAEGGADPSVRYQLSSAVAALLGLGADQITVVKMK